MDNRCKCKRIDDMIWYEAAMISTFPGVFDGCDDNYEVECRLTEAGVISPSDSPDSETCAVVVYFDNASQADGFEARLAKYIEEHTPVKA